MYICIKNFQDGESGDVEGEGESQTTMDSLVLAEAANVDVSLDDVELLIDDDYEGPLKPTVEAAIQAKWGKILGPDVEIVVSKDDCTVKIRFYQIQNILL